MGGLVPGRIVWYKLESGEERPAIVVKVFSSTCVNLRVFSNGPSDGLGEEATPLRCSVSYAEEGRAGFWRWPERG